MSPRAPASDEIRIAHLETEMERMRTEAKEVREKVDEHHTWWTQAWTLVKVGSFVWAAVWALTVAVIVSEVRAARASAPAAPGRIP